MNDFGTTFRRLRRAPAFTAASVVTIALGLGMTVTMLSAHREIIQRPLPVRDPDRLVVLWTHGGNPNLEVSGTIQQLTQQFSPAAKTLTNVAGVVHWGAVPTPFVDGDEPILLTRALVTGNYFDVLGATPFAGHFLNPQDPLDGTAQSMVISYGAWQRRFGGSASIVGHTLHDAFSKKIYTIVGVAPPGLDYPTGVEAWTLPWNLGLGAFAVARLAPGASASAARDEFEAIELRLLADLHRMVGATVTKFDDAVLGNSRAAITILAGAVALLLLIACANVGNLVLLRASSRRREMAIRRALGATVADVARHLMLEVVVLGALSGALGFALSHAMVGMLVRFAPAGTPRLDALRANGVSVNAAIGITILATAIVGAFSVVGYTHAGATSMLRVDNRSGSESRSRRAFRRSLVAAQVALAIVVLAGAGLLARSLNRLTHIDLGYTPDRLAVLQISWKTPDQSKLLQTGDALLERIRAVPGVQSATPILIPPFVGANVYHAPVTVEGRPIADVRNPTAPLELGDADYFRTFGIPIVRGRGFEDTDRENMPLVAVVSEAMARTLWPNENAIGKRINYWGPDSLAWRTVVGVAGDIRFRSLRDATPTIYLPWRQTTSWQLLFAARTTGDPLSTMTAIQRAVRAYDAGMNVWDSQFMSHYLARPLSQPRLAAFLLSAFGIFALLLAAIGLYGVMASSVRDQTREIGVRIALGATPARVRRDVLGQAAVMTVVGACAGLVLALLASRFASSLLFEISPTDPLALAGSSALLLGVALVAAYIPARGATRIDPMMALRSD